MSGPQQAFQKALGLREAGRYQEAESQFKRALEENPSNADYHFELANLYGIEHDEALQDKDGFRAGQYIESAARELEQAVMIRQDFMAAHFNLGVVYKKLGKYEKARTEFKRVLEQDPMQVQAMFQIAQVYELQSFYDEAESIYQEIRDRGLAQQTDIDYALDNLERQRLTASHNSQNQMAQSMSMMQNRLSSAYAEKYNPSLANSYGNSARPSFNGNSLVSSLAPLLMQQFMKGKSTQNTEQQDW